jgi:hypothetical protein
MTVVAGSVKRGGLLSPLVPSAGVGPDARAMQDIVHTAWGTLATSLALRRTAETAIAELTKALVIASRPNWDGYGALPADRGAAAQAIRFLQALPTTLPAPDVSVDPDGEIDVLWHVEATRTLSVSVARSGKLTYSALLGGAQSYGTEWFSNEIPQPILYSLSRVLDRNSR